jgi:TatD DNase family protein
LTQNQTPTTVYWLDNTLYLNITNQCSNSCYFCFKHYKQGVGGFNLKLAQEPSVEQIISELSEVLHMRNWSEIVFCGFGEPTSRLDVLLEVAKWIRHNFGRPVQLRLDTNGHGYKLNPNRDIAKELKNAGIDKVSVSLNAQDKQTYNEACKPAFPDAYEAMLEFIKKAKTQLEVEATAVRIPEIDMQKTQAAAESLGVKFKIREYTPCFY